VVPWPRHHKEVVRAIGLLEAGLLQEPLPNRRKVRVRCKVNATLLKARVGLEHAELRDVNGDKEEVGLSRVLHAEAGLAQAPVHLDGQRLAAAFVGPYDALMRIRKGRWQW
jgi:hypothetical protein